MPESLKVAATYSPPMHFRSPIGDAECVGARAALPRPSAPALCLAPRASAAGLEHGRAR